MQRERQQDDIPADGSRQVEGLWAAAVRAGLWVDRCSRPAAALLFGPSVALPEGLGGASQAITGSVWPALGTSGQHGLCQCMRPQGPPLAHLGHRDLQPSGLRVSLCVCPRSAVCRPPAHTAAYLCIQLNFVCPALLCFSLQALRRLNCPCACPSCAGLSTGCSARVTWSRGGRSRRGRGGSWTLPHAPARPGQVRAGGGPLCGRPTAAAHRCSSRLTAAHIRVCEQRRGQTPVLCNWHTAATEPAYSCSPCARTVAHAPAGRCRQGRRAEVRRAAGGCRAARGQSVRASHGQRSSAAAVSVCVCAILCDCVRVC